MGNSTWFSSWWRGRWSWNPLHLQPVHIHCPCPWWGFGQWRGAGWGLHPHTEVGQLGAKALEMGAPNGSTKLTAWAGLHNDQGLLNSLMRGRKDRSLTFAKLCWIFFPLRWASSKELPFTCGGWSQSSKLPSQEENLCHPASVPAPPRVAG